MLLKTGMTILQTASRSGEENTFVDEEILLPLLDMIACILSTANFNSATWETDSSK